MQPAELSPPSAPPAVREWCLGLPLIEERALSSEERAEFARLARRHGRARAAWAIVGLLGAAVSVATTQAWFGEPSRLLGWVLCLLLPLFPLLWAHEHDGRWRRRRGDARGSGVKVFQGPTRLFRARCLLRPDEWRGSQVTLEVGASKCVLSVNWLPVPEPHLVRTAVAAQAYVPAQVLEANSQATTTRALTPGERDEVRALARREVLEAFWPAFFGGLALSILGIVAVGNGAPTAADSPLLILVAMFLLPTWKLRVAWSRAQKMSRDAQAGHVECEAVTPDSAAREVGPRPVAREVLPLSKRAWTEGGEATVWRVGAST